MNARKWLRVLAGFLILAGCAISVFAAYWLGGHDISFQTVKKVSAASFPVSWTKVPEADVQPVVKVTEPPVVIQQSVDEEVQIADNQSDDVEEEIVGSWEIQYFAGATSEMKQWDFPSLFPAVWPEFPNVDNGQYPASQGLEYGEDLSVFCQQSELCDFIVPARHYRLYTGDYKFDSVGECFGEGKKGCALAVFNVGEVTASFEDQWMDAGFTVAGRYWDGNYLSQAIWALLSHASSNMLNMDSDLNPSVITNAGANCSVVPGCESVENTFVITSGNQILMIGRQTITQ